MFSYRSVLTYVLGAQKNRHNEMVLLSTHNIFWLRNKKIIFLSCALNLSPANISTCQLHWLFTLKSVNSDQMVSSDAI